MIIQVSSWLKHHVSSLVMVQEVEVLPHWQGCRRPCFVEPRTGISHEYCGRQHAIEAGALQPQQAPKGCCHTCNLDGCEESVYFDEATGRMCDASCSHRTHSHSISVSQAGSTTTAARATHSKTTAAPSNGTKQGNHGARSGAEAWPPKSNLGLPSQTLASQVQ